MARRDPAFLGKLKTAWDQLFKKNDRLILVLCSSVSSWVEQNLLSSTGFVGRVAVGPPPPNASTSLADATKSTFVILVLECADVLVTK